MTSSSALTSCARWAEGLHCKVNAAAEDEHQHPLWALILARLMQSSWVDCVVKWRGDVLLQAAVGRLCPVGVLQDAFEARSKSRNATLQAASGNGTAAAAQAFRSTVSLPTACWSCTVAPCPRGCMQYRATLTALLMCRPGTLLSLWHMLWLTNWR